MAKSPDGKSPKRPRAPTPRKRPAGKGRRAARAGDQAGEQQGGEGGRLPPQNGEAHGLAVDCKRADQIDQAKVEWLWPDRLAYGALTLWAGAAGVGKSTMATAIAAAVTNGRPLPGGVRIDPGSILWMGSEDDRAAVVIPRLAAAGADLSRVHFPEVKRDGRRRRWHFPGDEDEFLTLARELKAKLVVLDPISAFIDGDLLADSGQAARLVMESLGNVAVAASLAVLGIKHPRKGTSGTPMECVSGSREYTNVPRAVAQLVNRAGDKTINVLSPLKNSYGPLPPALLYKLTPSEGTVRVEWIGQSSLTAEELLEEQGDSVSRDALVEAKALLKDQLGDGDRKAKDLLRAAEEAGISLITLRRAKSALKVTSHPVGPNEARHQVWRRPEGGWAE